MAKHEFGIINEFDENKDYSAYEPEQYDCISIHDDYIVELTKYLRILQTYHHNFNRKEFGLAYHGVTIIPPKSLMLFYDIVSTSNQFKKSQELATLGALLIDAKIRNKHVIHFGI